MLDEIIAPIRERREFYKNNMDLVIASMEKGSANMRIIGQKLLGELKEKMGILEYGKELRK